MEPNIADYCNREIRCACGRTHYCPIETVLIERGALGALPDLLKRYRAVLLVADENTMAACGAKVADLPVPGIAKVLVYRRAGRLVPDEAAVAELEAEVTAETDCILGVGSGVINDLCKYVSFRRGLDYAIVATAPSMDGYASSGAAMIVSGMKVTYPAHPPSMIIADTDILKNAPTEMISSGYGDVIGKFSSLNDWRLSALVNGELLCGDIYDLVERVARGVRDRAADIAARTDDAVAYLTKALVLSGITLSLMGTTRPGSGSEHHLSHFFEITGLIRGEPHFIHGTDVGYATVVTAALREELCGMATPRFVTVPEAAREAAYRRIFGDFAPEVRAIQEKAGWYRKDLTPVYTEKWDEIRAVLADAPTAEEVKAMLAPVGYDMRVFREKYGERKIRDAILYAKDLKDRYTVLWPYYAVAGQG